MSDFSDAFAELQDAQDSAEGEAITATVGGVTAGAVVGKARYDQILVAGGVTDSGGITLEMAIADFPDGRPAKLSVVTFGDKTMRMLDCEQSHGTYFMVCGSPVARE